MMQQQHQGMQQQMTQQQMTQQQMTQQQMTQQQMSQQQMTQQSQAFIDLNELPMDPNQQTLMWQQNQYMNADSGIHSGVTTGAHSVSSKCGVMEGGPAPMDVPPGMDACEDMGEGQRLIYDFDSGYQTGGPYTPHEQMVDGNYLLVCN